MALINCHECGKEVSDEAAACPHCGAKKQKKSSPSLKWPLISFVVFIFALVVMASPKDPLREERLRDSRAISACWEVYEKKSLSYDVKLTAASMCEKMEASFENKYGRKP